MKKHDEPYKRYNVYIPIRIWEAIAQHAYGKNRPISQEVEHALGWYVELLEEAEVTMQSGAKRLQAEYETKKEE